MDPVLSRSKQPFVFSLFGYIQILFILLNFSFDVFYARAGFFLSAYSSCAGISKLITLLQYLHKGLIYFSSTWEDVDI